MREAEGRLPPVGTGNGIMSSNETCYMRLYVQRHTLCRHLVPRTRSACDSSIDEGSTLKFPFTLVKLHF